MVDLPRWGMPWPARRKTRPFCVSGGIFSASLPLSVGTCTSPPSMATVSGTAIVVVQIVALAFEGGVGADGDIQIKVAAGAATVARLSLAGDAYPRAGG